MNLHENREVFEEVLTAASLPVEWSKGELASDLPSLKRIIG